MHHRLLARAALVAALIAAVACAAPSNAAPNGPSASPTAAPAAATEAQAMVWKVQGRPLLDSYRNPWRFVSAGDPRSGEVIRVGGATAPVALADHVAAIAEALGRKPYALRRATEGGGLQLIDPENGQPLSNAVLNDGDAIAADARQLARVVNTQAKDTVVQRIDIQVGATDGAAPRTIASIDNYEQLQSLARLFWGAQRLYGTLTRSPATTSEHMTTALWWIDPAAKDAQPQELWYGEREYIDSVAVDPAHDQIAYTWTPNRFMTTGTITSALQIRSATSGQIRTLDIGGAFTHLGFSPDGRYLAALHSAVPSSAAYELRLYDLAAAGPPTTLSRAISPWEVRWYGQSVSGDIYRWTADGAYLLVLTGASIQLERNGTPKGLDEPRHTLIYRTDTKKLIDASYLPQSTGSIWIANSSKPQVLSISYDDSGAAILHRYSPEQHRSAAPVALGVGSAVIIDVR